MGTESYSIQLSFSKLKRRLVKLNNPLDGDGNLNTDMHRNVPYE